MFDNILSAVIIIAIIILLYKCIRCNCPETHLCTRGKLTICPCKENLKSAINLNREVTLHYTAWCHYCKQMKPIWEQVKTTCMQSNAGIIFKESDEDKTPTPGINAIPTILMIDESGHMSKYQGRPDYNALLAWIITPAQHLQ